MRDDSTRVRSSITPTSDLSGITALAHWRQTLRADVLRDLARQTKGLRWSPRLLRVLLDELFLGDEPVEFRGIVRRSTFAHAAQVIALRLIARHSWTPHDLAQLARRLHLSIARTPTTSHKSAAPTPDFRPSRTSARRHQRAFRDTRPRRRRA
ncbi:MAG: hypothetical protein JNM38_12070 [Acidobacteria bacterium]|nr:hypothetical protein [Acidobacteriota bacterium]